MPYTGTGSYSREHNWAADKAGAIPVTASRMDTEHDGFATGLSTVICRDGQSTTTSRIPFAAGASVFDGSLATPGLNFTSDPDCGLYRSAPNTWQLVAGATTIATLTTAAFTLAKPLVGTTLSLSGASEFSSSLSVDGDFDVNTTAFTVDASTGNITAAGTFRLGGALPSGATAGAFSHNVTNASTAGVTWAVAHNKSVTGATDDLVWQLDIYGKDTASNTQNYGRLECLAEDATSGGEDGMFRWRVARAGSLTSIMILSGEGDGTHASLKPVVSDTLCLGTSSAWISDIYMASGSVLNFANGNMALTHSTNTLTLVAAVPGSATLNLECSLAVTGTDFTVTGGSGVVNTVGHYSVSGTQVVGAQGAVVADATAGNVATQFNTLLNRLRVHGLIDT